jgi:triphosphatase
VAIETELKLRVPPAALSAVRRHPLLRGAGRPGVLRMHAIYYDTPACELLERGIALRVRREGGRWIQTLKSAGSVEAGLHRRAELVTELPGPLPEPDRISDPGVGKLLAGLEAAPLQLVFETLFTRSRRIVQADAAVVEVSIDEGLARCGERSEPFCEIELELRNGPVAPLFALALALAQNVPVAIERKSKAERGYRLYRAAAPPPPARAVRAQLSADLCVGRAFTTIAAGALAHVEANEEGVLAAEDPEYLHQMRVGLRRLRSAVAAFSRALPADAAAPLSEELQWLAGSLGAARDWDVLMTEILAPAEPLFGSDAGWRALHIRCKQEREAARRAAREALRSVRYTRVLLTIAASIARVDSPGHAGAHAAALRAPVRDYAVEALERCHRRVRKRGRRLEGLEDEELHRLRIALKKLRYGVEFFGSLFEVEAVRAFRAPVTALQDLLGRLNDAATAQRLVRERFAGQADHESSAAAGVLLGWIAGRSDALRGELNSAWKELRRADVFW